MKNILEFLEDDTKFYFVLSSIIFWVLINVLIIL